jgi:hypothetical protein
MHDPFTIILLSRHTQPLAVITERSGHEHCELFVAPDDVIAFNGHGMGADEADGQKKPTGHITTSAPPGQNLPAGHTLDSPSTQ